MIDRVHLLKEAEDAGFDPRNVHYGDRGAFERLKHLSPIFGWRIWLQRALLEEDSLAEWVTKDNAGYFEGLAQLVYKHKDRITNYKKEIVLAEVCQEVPAWTAYVFIRNFNDLSCCHTVMANLRDYARDRLDLSESEKVFLSKVPNISPVMVPIEEFTALSALPFIKELVNKMQELNIKETLTYEKMSRITGDVCKLLNRPGFLYCWATCGFRDKDLHMLDEAGDYVFQSNLTYTGYIYGFDVSELHLQDWQTAIVIYAISHNKAEFLKLIKESPVFKELTSDSLLFHEEFYRDCVDVDELTEADLKELFTMHGSGAYLVGKLSFEEVKDLYGIPDSYRKMYMKLEKGNTAQFRYLKDHGLLGKSCSIVERLNEKPIFEWVSGEFSHIEGISAESAVDLLTVAEISADAVKHLTHVSEIPLFLRNSRPGADDPEWLKLAEALHLEEEFLEAHKANIRKFVMSNGAQIVNKYMKNIHETDEIKLLTRAELMGRFREIRYVGECLHKEIDLIVNDTWNDNITVTDGEFTAVEHDDFLSIVQLGETPISTCLSYERGSNVNCLLSFFDACKKIVTVEHDGIVLARAVIRLTKVRRRVSELSYLPTEKDSETKTAVVTETMRNRDISEAWRTCAAELILKLAKEKAGKLGACVLMDSSYSSQLDTAVSPVAINMYVTSSRAPRQYLATLGGVIEKQSEGSYIRVRVLTEGGS
jgi:hypothetical protein